MSLIRDVSDARQLGSKAAQISDDCMSDDCISDGCSELESKAAQISDDCMSDD